MTNPETTLLQAQGLLSTLAFQPVTIDGRKLSARVTENGTHDVIVKVDGKHRWAKTPSYTMTFEGGKWGSHTLYLHNSSPERLAAHWDGYKAAHEQDVERRTALASQPAAQVYKPEVWHPKVGDQVFFRRGMFGSWQGTIRSLYQARGPRLGVGPQKGEPLADISFRGANGKRYVYDRVEVKTLTHHGRKAALGTL